MLDKTNSDFKIIAYSKKYYDDWIDLFEKTTKKRMHGIHYLYNTEENPFGKPIQFLMKYKGKIVGSHSIRPLQFRIKDKVVLGGLTYDSLTDPDYQNRGIFTALVQRTHEEAKKQNYHLVCGYANSNSIDIYQKNLKHKKLKEINFIKITDFDKVKDLEPFGSRSNSIPEDFTKGVLHKKKEPFSCSVHKTIKYLTWRYDQRDKRHFVYYHYARFLIIVKQYEQQFQIVDFFAKDADAFRTALSIVDHFAKEYKIPDVTMWINPNHHFLKEAGMKYETLTAKQYFHVISFNDNLTQYIIDSHNWNYTMGDSDVF